MNNQQIECERIDAPLEIFTKAIDRNTTAQLQLGKVYHNATSVENHGTVAFDWIHRPENQGNMEEPHTFTYNTKRKKNHEFEKIDISADIATKAEDDDAAAQLELGKACCKATSVENHDSLSFNWIHRSAEQGNMEAQFKLGDFYALGYGTAISLPESYKWYTKSAIQGYKKALIRIHNLYQEDIKMYCRGRLNALEKDKNKVFRELFEWRLNQYKSVLNYALDYYTNLFKICQSSDQKDPVVQLNLGFLYQHGYGTKKCSRWSFEYYSLAAEQGNIDAQYNLGCLYQQHTEKKFNVRDAFKWYTRSAQGGHIVAQRCLAYFHLKGLATDINYEMSVYWYTKAAEAGDSQSQVILGKLYRKGDYVKQDLSMAVRWYTLAARQGSIVAKNCLSKLHKREMLENIKLEEDMLEFLTEDSINYRICSKLSEDISKLEDSSEFKNLNKLAKNALTSDGAAMHEIGLKYFYGDREFSQDKDVGIKWIKNAAKRKLVDAQFFMAKLYKDGDSAEQDYYKSYIWYKAISKQKDAVSQCQIGIMYLNGEGVRQDRLEASKWFIWAANQGNSDAQLNLGLLRLNGYGIRKDEKEAKRWFYKSVCQRNIQACYQLGKIIFTGTDGSEKKLGTGLKLLEFAASHDDTDSQLFLGNAYEKGTGVQQDLSKSIEYCTMAANSGSKIAQGKLAIAYLNGDGVEYDYIKAYRLFQLAKDSNYWEVNGLFQVPIKENQYIKDHSKIINMFMEVTENGMDYLYFIIGSIYEHGIRAHSEDNNKVNINYNEARRWYLVASENGDSRGDYCLGIMYENGNGVEKNMSAAISYYNKAVEKENIDAMKRLAVIYLEGYGIVRNVLEAFHSYTKAAYMGDMVAAELLTDFQRDKGFMYWVYRLGKSDSEKYINMLEKATEEGFTRLQYQIGVMYERKDDYSKAFKWFTLAADIGVTDAYYRLGIMYEKGKGLRQRYTMAAEMYQKAAEKDHKEACFRLGQFYLYGNGVELNYLNAYSFYKKAANMGHDTALKTLNITQEINIKANGDIEKNFFDILSKEYQGSLTMCKFVAEQGDFKVQFKIGFAAEYCYSKPDYGEAYKWYSMAAKHSHKEAMYHLGLLCENGLGFIQDYHRAIRLYNQAHQRGSNDALHQLGIMYHYGKGVKTDPIKAVECYTLSAKVGNPKYQCKLGRLYEEGELVPKNPLEALKWYTKAYLQGYDKIRSKLYTFYEDKPYETFFFERLFRNLSIATCNYFSLNDDYEYKNYGDINNRLGLMCFFGIGTNKNLEQSLQYFLKKYSDEEETSDTFLRFFYYNGFSFGQKVKILEEFENDEECMSQLSPELQYTFGMVFYKGKVKSQYFTYDSYRNIYTPIDKRDLNNPNKRIIIEKNYLVALKYIKNAAGQKHPCAWVQLGIMYHCGHGVPENSDQNGAYFDITLDDNVDLIKEMAVLYHTYNDIQNFSKAIEYYSHLEKTLAEDSVLSEEIQKKISQFVQLGLGLLYEYGDGVEKDYKKALEYYKKLVDNNHKIGYLRLGLMHYYGKGVPVNYKNAFDLFERSSNGNICRDRFPYVYGQSNLQTGDDGDTTERKRAYHIKTKKEIDGELYYYRGLMYKHGYGVRKDEIEAQNYFRKAIERRCQRAANKLEIFKYKI